MDLCKKKKSLDETVSEKEEGRTWIWTALDTSTRLIVTFLVGDRCLEDARHFLEDLTARMEDKPLFVSDELPHYAEGLEALFHDWIQSEPTGRRGRPQNPKRVVHEDLDYATVHKTRDRGRVVHVETRVIFGSESRIETRLEDSPSHRINTSFVERSNLNWRLWDAHLTRKALTFAKSIHWLRAKFSIVVAFYNFIRPHGSLSRKNNSTFHPITPGMAAGVTDHPWTIDELLCYQVSCQ